MKDVYSRDMLDKAFDEYWRVKHHLIEMCKEFDDSPEVAERLRRAILETKRKKKE